MDFDNLDLSGEFLSYVIYVKPNAYMKFARLKPLFRIDGECWKDIRDDDERFQDEGLVFWWDPPLDIQEEDLYVVTLKPQLKYEEGDKKHADRSQVNCAWKPFEAISLSEIGSTSSFRHSLARGQIPVNTRPKGRPLINLPNDPLKWIVFSDHKFEANADSSHLICTSALEGVIPTHTISNEEFTEVTVEGNQYKILLELPPADSFTCALSDSQLLEHIRKKISAHDSEFLKALEISKAILRKYAPIFEESLPKGKEALKDLARLQAAKCLLENLELSEQQVAELSDSLQLYGPISERLEIEKKELLTKTERNWIARLEEEHKVVETELAKKKQELDEVKARLFQLNDELSKATESIVSDPIQSLSKHLILERLANSFHNKGAPPIESTAAPVLSESIHTLDLPPHLATAINQWALSIGIHPQVLQMAISALIGSNICLVGGPDSEQLATALASTLSGRSSVRVAVSSAVFGISEIMNSPITTLGETKIAHPYTLGQFLSSQSDDMPVTIVLSGINRAPLETTLPDLLIASSTSGSNLSWLDPKGMPQTTSLPKHIYFVGTLYDGEAVFSVPVSLANKLPLLHSESIESLPRIPSEASSPEPTEATINLLETLRTPIQMGQTKNLADWLVEQGALLNTNDLLSIISVHTQILGNLESGFLSVASCFLPARAHSLTTDELHKFGMDNTAERLTALSSEKGWMRLSRYLTKEDDK